MAWSPEPLNPSLFSPQSDVETEYSNPFDAQPPPPAPEDDGYMEPYEAQRVVSGEWPGNTREMLGSRGSELLLKT